MNKDYQKNRNDRIFFFYKILLFNLNLDNSVKELDKAIGDLNIDYKDIQAIDNTLKNLSKIILKLKKFLPKDWKWERINNIEKAVLINSISEIELLKIKKAIVINEAIIFIKKYSDKDSYKLVNAILDNF